MVSLRAVEPADLPVFYEHQLDEESNAMAQFTARDREAFDAHWATILADDTLIARTVVADGEVVGNVVSWPAGDERLVGYWIGKPFWGRGYATQALAAFLAEFPERPLRARVAPHNAGSIRVLEKCGFRFLDRVEADDGAIDLVYEL